MSQQIPTITQANKYAKSFILYGDMSKAFMAAFPDSKLKPAGVNTKASSIHKTVEIQLRIEALQLAAKKAAEKKFALTTNDLQKTLSKVMKKGLSDKKDKHGNKSAQNLSAVVSAIKEVNLMNGNHAKIQANIELTPGDGASMEMRVTSDPKESGKAYQAMLNGNNE